MGQYKLGYLPDAHDPNETYEAAAKYGAVHLPAKVDLTPGLPSAWNQADESSCTVHATGMAFCYDLIRQNLKPFFTPSRNALYYVSGELEGTERLDCGRQITSVIKAIVNYGVFPEEMWPYDEKRFAERPPEAALRDGALHTITDWGKLNANASEVKSVLAARFPIVLGAMVYSSLMSDDVASTGVAPMPSGSDTLEGGHCILMTGYDDETQRWKFRNSWGADWGDEGNFTFPYEYLQPNLMGDLTVLRATRKY